MKKTKKKLLFTAVTTMVACSLSAGLVMTAFADEATKDHEFDARNGDSVFEDFDRANLAPIVATTTPENTDLGVKPYLHVEYTAEHAMDVGQIYKQGSGTLNGMQKGGVLTIRMRSPKGDATLSELNLGIRGTDHDKDDQVAYMGFDELKDKGGVALTELTTEWQTYDISVVMSYTDKTYGSGEGAVDVVGNAAENAVAIHIFADDGESGTVDIEYVSFGTNVLNTFMGGSTLKEMGQATDGPATWWADSIEGSVVKRIPTLSKDGDMTVVKDTAVGDYKYAIIETQGDITGLKVATTTDGENFGEAVAYDGYSVALTGKEKGFKLINEGDDSVQIKRIYLTNLAVIVPDAATPVIDAKTAEYLDDFSVAQSGFTGVYADMAAAPEAAEANMYFRMSYANGDKVNVKDGALVMEAVEGGHTNFIFNSKTLYTQKYVVLKMKLEGEGANLDKFRFKLMGEGDALTDEVEAPAFKSGVGYKSKLLTDDNPYRDGGWYYVIVDIAESGFKYFETGYSGMDLYYQGKGKLYIDEIFFADKKDLPPIIKNVKPGSSADLAAVTDYNPGYIYIPNLDGTASTITLDITAKDDNFDISNLRMEFEGVGTYWAAENTEGTLITTDGNKLNELTYAKDVPTTVVIDLEKSGIVGAFQHVHLHRHSIGAFKIDNVIVNIPVDPYVAKDLDTENAVTVMDGEQAKTITVSEPTGAYTYAGGLDVAKNVYGKLEFKFTPGADFGIVNGIRLEFADVGERWASENEKGSLITTDGKRIDEFVAAYLEEHPDYANEPITVEIDLAASGITEAFKTVHIHTNGAETGGFTITDAKFTPYVDYLSDYYKEALDELPLYLDTVLPTVGITNELTAKVGDEITVAYTASDNKTATADLAIEVTVTKDGEAVALNDGKFTAEEGVYTVTVKVTDIAGNEATDTKQITVTKKATTTAPVATTGDNDGKLSTGAIVGIVVGCVAGVGLIVGGVFLALHFLKKKKGDKKEENKEEKNENN